MLTYSFKQEPGRFWGELFQIFKSAIPKYLWPLFIIFGGLLLLGFISFEYLPKEHVVLFFWIIASLLLFFIIPFGYQALKGFVSDLKTVSNDHDDKAHKKTG